MTARAFWRILICVCAVVGAVTLVLLACYGIAHAAVGPEDGWGAVVTNILNHSLVPGNRHVVCKQTGVTGHGKALTVYVKCHFLEN